jgi:hypothetical protein
MVARLDSAAGRDRAGRSGIGLGHRGQRGAEARLSRASAASPWCTHALLMCNGWAEANLREIQQDDRCAYADTRSAAFLLLGGCVVWLLAEGVGFEPTETRNASPVFKTGAIGH